MMQVSSCPSSEFRDEFLTFLHRPHHQKLSTIMAVKRTSPVQANAMPWPIFDKLRDKRVVLASASPRRKDILANVVSHWSSLVIHDGYCSQSTTALATRICTTLADTPPRASSPRLSPPHSRRTSPSRCSRTAWPTTPSRRQARRRWRCTAA
jgi:hypothetical protein